MSTATMLPERFAELEPFAPMWSVADANERYERRLVSSMEDLQAFYDVATRRGEEAIAYLNDFDITDLPDAEANLLWMYCSLSAVGFAVDVFRQPTVPETCGATMPWTVVPYP
ncbi:MAG TPA: hypothetical protein VGM78_02885 [Ilumatobacteraceae bacterium]|jgi:hypothetical protein